MGETPALPIVNWKQRWLPLMGGVLAVFLVLGAVVVGLKSISDDGDQSGRSVSPVMRDYPVPPRLKSKYANTEPHAEYVGFKSCRICHPDEHATYQQTFHSRAFSKVRVSDAPPDGKFLHQASQRWYESFRRGDQLWHRESFDANGQNLEIQEHPLSFVIGSGHHMQSYLMGFDGFLSESPITWYSGQKRWRISPGFDVPLHPGFERPIIAECLICHTGRVETVDGSPQQFQIHEMSIGCERCHGPGSLHVALRKSREGQLKDWPEIDHTIVNPARLSRKLEMDVCAQCHLHSAAVVEVRGRAVDDFRPGLPLEEFRIDYRFEHKNESMTEVGHFEQLLRSRCYQKSGTLTCTTCHNPHLQTDEQDELNFYRQKCLSCHALDDCGEKPANRVAGKRQDNCVACHMPQSPIEILHVAFTHHRIGIHDSARPADQPAVPSETLVPLHTVEHLPEIDRERCLGLALFAVWRSGSPDPAAIPFKRRAIALLQRVHNQGLHDATAEAALAILLMDSHPKLSILHAETALQAENITANTRCDALAALGTSHLKLNNPQSAAPSLKSLVTLRRLADDWMMLAICRENLGDLTGAVRAAMAAADISPTRADTQERLASLYRRLGDRRRSADHDRRGKRLRSTIRAVLER